MIMPERAQGIVLRAFGDRVQVKTDAGIGNYRPKGSLRATGVLAGDRVTIEGEHVVAVAERRNRLGRPPVANADVLLAIVALRRPEVSPQDLDRLLLQAEAADLRAIVVMNKMDLATDEEANAYLAPYRQAGYEVVRAASNLPGGVEVLRSALPPGLGVLAGPSGVGKSSLLSALTGEQVEVADLSEHLGRGRHTTRAATLYQVGEGRMLADTPGFSALELPEVEAHQLRQLYPEFQRFACRFNDCMHRAEPDCIVRAAADKGEIDGGRYGRYLEFLGQIEGRPKKWH